MKMFHRSHIVAHITRRAKQAHHNDAKTMENLHRLPMLHKSHEKLLRWKNDGNLPWIAHRL